MIAFAHRVTFVRAFDVATSIAPLVAFKVPVDADVVGRVLVEVAEDDLDGTGERNFASGSAQGTGDDPGIERESRVGRVEVDGSAFCAQVDSGSGEDLVKISVAEED